jgi:hypothetical protein
MSPLSVLKHASTPLEIPLPDQRLHRRYAISLDLQYKLRNPGQVAMFGTGRIFNISSGGIFFQTSGSLPTRGDIELLIQWPFFLDGRCPLKLVVQGRIVRSDANGIAVRVLRHEFRTSKRPIA